MAFRLIGEQLFDNNGDPLNGGKVNVYVSGTTTAKDSYPTADDADAGTNANANPVVLDSSGRAQIWGRDGETYKLVITTSADVTLDTIDDIPGRNSQQSAIGYYVGSGTANAQTITASPVWTAYTAGSIIAWLPVADNTGDTTLNVNGVGAGSLLLEGGAEIYPGALQTDYIAVAMHDGTNFILLNPAEYRSSYTGTLTGLTTSPTVTVYYVQNGSVVTLLIETATSGTSNSTAFTITGAPASIRPTAAAGIISTVVTNNSNTSQGFVSLDESGVLTFGNGASTAGFTSSGTKGVIRLNYTYYLK